MKNMMINNNKIITNAKSLAAVYIYIYIVNCLLENKKELQKNILNRDRIMLLKHDSISLSLSVLITKNIFREEKERSTKIRKRFR